MGVAPLSFLFLLLAHPPGDCSKGIALHSQNRIRESLSALSNCKESVEAQFYIGLNYRALENHADARKYLLAAFQAGYDNPLLLYSLIEEENELGEKAAGLDHFQSMLRRYPDSAWTHVLLGNAYFSTQRDKEAKLEYEHALARDPNLPDVNFRLGYLAYGAAQYESALAYFQHEIGINPLHPAANLFCGQTLKVMGRNREALGYLQKAISLDRQSAVGYRTLASVLVALNRSDDAITTLIQAEKLFPTDPAFPASLSHLYFGLHRDEEAKQAAGRARVLMAVKREKGQ